MSLSCSIIGDSRCADNWKCLRFMGRCIVDDSYFWNFFAAVDRKNPHHTLYEWAIRHGPIFRCQVLGENIVVLNSPEYIRLANQGEFIDIFPIN